MDTYDPKKVVVIYNGSTIEGFMEGTFVNIVRDSETSVIVSGADGKTARAKTNDKRGTVTLTLLQTSKSNKVFSSVIARDENGEDAKFPLFIKNTNGDDLYQDKEAIVERPAASTFTKGGIEGREWILKCQSLSCQTNGVQ